MSNLVEVGKTSEFPVGTVKEVRTEGHEILLARVGDKYYAVDNRCPHLGGKLSQGKIEGTIVICPRHGSKFDLRDGQVVRWLNGSGLMSKIGRALKSPRSLKTYNVDVQQDKILIEI